MANEKTIRMARHMRCRMIMTDSKENTRINVPDPPLSIEFQKIHTPMQMRNTTFLIHLCTRKNAHRDLIIPNTPITPIQTVLIRTGRMLPILRPISIRRSFATPILQETVAWPSLESPRQIGVVRNPIACRSSATVRIVLIAVVDAVLESVFGDRVLRLVVCAYWEVPDPG
jgi:hypothetical protein